MLDFYKLLGVPFLATDVEIKYAFRQMAKIHHPDINKSPEAGDTFRLLYVAYDTLSDPFKRKMYDRLLQEDHQSSDQPLSRAYYEKMQRRAAMRARSYAAMQYEEFEETAFTRVSFHVKQVIAFLLFFTMMCVGMAAFIVGARYVFSEHYNGAQVTGYGFWIAGGVVCYISGKALLSIYEIWRS